MTFCCFRGDTQLSEEDLQVHLASAFRLENIGALIGAGGSVCAGGKTIKQLWLEFIEEEAGTAAMLVMYSFIEEEEANPQTFHNDPTRQPPNIEELLDALEIALIEAKRAGQVVFRILCHFVKLSKKEMTYDQNQFRHGCRFKAVA